MVDPEAILENLTFVVFASEIKPGLDYFPVLQNPAGKEFIMSMSDPIADMLTRIRNGCLRKHRQVCIPYSKIKFNITLVLYDEGFIESYSKDLECNILSINLKYFGKNRESVIRKIDRISKPGLRIYKACSSLLPVMNGQGINILTTSHGVLSDNQCREQGISGELLCSVY